MSQKVWYCSVCNIYFKPEPELFSCPNCKGNTTFPAKDYDSLQNELWEPPDRTPRRISCSECGTLMAAGFVVEKNAPLDLLTLGEGIYWTPNELGPLGCEIWACILCLSQLWKRDFNFEI